MSPGKRKEIDIIFSKADGYRLVPATGAWGGVSPQKEVVVDFYIDHRSNPKSIHLTTEGDERKARRNPDPQPFERAVQFGVVLRPDIARTIGEFLIEHADKAMQAEGD